MKKIRMSLDITPAMKKIIEDLSAGITQAETLKTAIIVLNAIKQGEKNGEAAVMIKDGKIVARLVGF